MMPDMTRWAESSSYSSLIGAKGIRAPFSPAIITSVFEAAVEAIFIVELSKRFYSLSLCILSALIALILRKSNS